MADQLAVKIDDATITASINAELAKDPALRALKIDVDTEEGHVRLRGAAPDREARNRATSLAAAVKGVVGIDNQLKIRNG
jgi:osmotically-inducible protein OsmY